MSQFGKANIDELGLCLFYVAWKLCIFEKHVFREVYYNLHLWEIFWLGKIIWDVIGSIYGLKESI